VTKEDIKSFVKGLMQSGNGKGATAGASLGGGLDLLPWPKVDFSKFGEIEVQIEPHQENFRPKPVAQLGGDSARDRQRRR
jgi:hypothetical protein